MTQLPAVFNSNAAGQERQGDYTPIPAATYAAQVVESDMVETKAKTGKMLVLKWEILTPGDQCGRKYTQRLNIINPNPIAVEIANKSLASICDAVGIPVVTDSQELHMRPINITLKITPASAGYGEGNEIDKYEAIGGQVAGAVGPTTPAANAGTVAPSQTPSGMPAIQPANPAPAVPGAPGTSPPWST